jgi:hypothetical protein
MRATRLLSLLFCVFWFGACVPSGDAETTTTDDGLAGAEQVPAAEIKAIHELPPPTDHTASEGERDSYGNVDLNPDPAASSRELRRLTIDQLQASISRVTGGLSWRNGNTDEFERLKTTLGVPNYLDTTNEDLDASLVFQKFLGDGVRAVCTEAIANDTLMEREDRVMVRFVEMSQDWESADDEGKAAIDENLRYMKLRITGRYVAPDDEVGVARLRWLFRSVARATGETDRAWRAVCVGLMSSPEFYLY